MKKINFLITRELLNRWGTTESLRICRNSLGSKELSSAIVYIAPSLTPLDSMDGSSVQEF